MPNHFHWVWQLRSEQTLARVQLRLMKFVFWRLIRGHRQHSIPLVTNVGLFSHTSGTESLGRHHFEAVSF